MAIFKNGEIYKGDDKPKSETIDLLLSDVEINSTIEYYIRQEVESTTLLRTIAKVLKADIYDSAKMEILTELTKEIL